MDGMKWINNAYMYINICESSKQSHKQCYNNMHAAKIGIHLLGLALHHTNTDRIIDKEYNDQET